MHAVILFPIRKSDTKIPVSATISMVVAIASSITPRFLSAAVPFLSTHDGKPAYHERRDQQRVVRRRRR